MIDATLRLGDERPTLYAELEDADGQPVNLAGATVDLELRGATVDYAEHTFSAEIVSAPAGTVQWVLTDGVILPAGLLFARWLVTYTDNDNESFPNSGNGFVIRIIE